MKHLYWRKDDFEALRAFEKKLREEPRFALLADYAALREKGLRKQSLQVLDSFIEAAERYDWPTKQKLVRIISEAKLEYGHDALLFVPEPLAKKFIVPTLDEWIQSEPQNSEPYKWKGLFCEVTEARELLEKALALNPLDQAVIDRLISRDLYDLWYATHELHGGHFLGDPDAALQLCGDLGARVGTIRDHVGRDQFVNAVRYYTEWIQDWVAYKLNGPAESFPEYCKKLGKKYAWTQTYYFKK